MQKSGHFGPLIGGVAGAFPQCGFSAAAASLYSGGVISAGTLLAIFLSTSDEMLPIFISESVAAGTILRILGLKIVLGAVSGFAIDVLWRFGGKKRRERDIIIYTENIMRKISMICANPNTAIVRTAAL